MYINSDDEMGVWHGHICDGAINLCGTHLASIVMVDLDSKKSVTRLHDFDK